MERCKWCQDGAKDLVYDKQGLSRGEIDWLTGVMKITVFPDAFAMNPIIATNVVNYCPMCGRPVGQKPQEEDSDWKFVEKISTVLRWDRLSISRLISLAGCIAWDDAKDSVGLRFCDDEELCKRLQEKFGKRFP